MTKIFAIVMFAGLAACSSKKPEEGKEPLVAPPPVPAPGSAPAPAPGASAGSAGSAAATTPEAAPSAGSATPPSLIACATPVELHCDAGQTDGCTGGLTAVHLCVAAGAKPGAPCAQGAALTCPAGQSDACTYTPPYASNHLCVVVPRSTP